MNVIDAAYNTVHDFKGGSGALAPRIGVSSAAVLNSKVNPNTDSHHLTLLEASKLMGVTNDFRILHSLAAEHGKVCIPMPAKMTSNEISIFEAFLDISVSHGDVCATFKEMMADGRVTEGEAVDMRAAIYEMQKSLTLLAEQVDNCKTK